MPVLMRPADEVSARRSPTRAHTHKHTHTHAPYTRARGGQRARTSLACLAPARPHPPPTPVAHAHNSPGATATRAAPARTVASKLMFVTRSVQLSSRVVPYTTPRDQARAAHTRLGATASAHRGHRRAGATSATPEARSHIPARRHARSAVSAHGACARRHPHAPYVRSATAAAAAAAALPLRLDRLVPNVCLQGQRSHATQARARKHTHAHINTLLHAAPHTRTHGGRAPASAPRTSCPCAAGAPPPRRARPASHDTVICHAPGGAPLATVIARARECHMPERRPSPASCPHPAARSAPAGRRRVPHVTPRTTLKPPPPPPAPHALLQTIASSGSLPRARAPRRRTLPTSAPAAWRAAAPVTATRRAAPERRAPLSPVAASSSAAAAADT